MRMDDATKPEPELIRRIVEAALLAAGEPLSLARLRELFPLDSAPEEGAIQAALDALRLACSDRGIELVEVASGFRYQVRAELHPWVARLWAERPQRYTRATLETLALIAYRQPITRGEIEQVRGVSVSSNIIKTLEEREWIRVIGHRDVPGKPALFGTTRQFLDYFGLHSLDQLPPLSELRDLAELDPQLSLPDSEHDTAEAPPALPDLREAGDIEVNPEVAVIARVAPASGPAGNPPENETASPESGTATEHTA